jgi:hypothetical protein
MKSQIAVLGVSLIVLFLNIGIAALGTGIQAAAIVLTSIGMYFGQKRRTVA